MFRRPPRSTRTDTPFPYTTLVRSTVRLTAVRTAVVRVDVDPSGRLTPARLTEGMATLRQLCGPVGAEVVDADLTVMPSNRREVRSEEHTSELQSLMRISYAVFCLKKKTIVQLEESNRLYTQT